MILLDVATELKKSFGYEEIPVPDLVNVLRDGFSAMGTMIAKEGEGTVMAIPKFGSFKLVKRPARIGRNPKTGEKLNIPEKVVVRFKPSSLFKEQLTVSKTQTKAEAKAEKKAKAKAEAKTSKK